MSISISSFFRSYLLLLFIIAPAFSFAQSSAQQNMRDAQALDAAERSKSVRSSAFMADDIALEVFKWAHEYHSERAAASKDRYMASRDFVFKKINFEALVKNAEAGDALDAYRLALILDYKIIDPSQLGFDAKKDLFIHQLYQIASEAGIVSANERLQVHYLTHGPNGENGRNVEAALWHHYKFYQGMDTGKSGTELATTYVKNIYNAYSEEEKNTVAGRSLIGAYYQMIKDFKKAKVYFEDCAAAGNLACKVDLAYSLLEQGKLKKKQKGLVRSLILESLDIIKNANAEDYAPNELVTTKAFAYYILFTLTEGVEYRSEFEASLKESAEQGVKIWMFHSTNFYKFGFLSIKPNEKLKEYYVNKILNSTVPDFPENPVHLFSIPSTYWFTRSMTEERRFTEQEARLPHTEWADPIEFRQMIESIDQPVVVFVWNMTITDMGYVTEIRDRIAKVGKNHRYIVYCTEQPRTNHFRNQQLLAISGVAGTHYNRRYAEGQSVQDIAKMPEGKSAILVYKADKSARPKRLGLYLEDNHLEKALVEDQ